MGLNGNLTKPKMHQLKKSDFGLKVIFSQENKNKIIFYEKMKTQVSPQYSCAEKNFLYCVIKNYNKVQI